jgi:hypothetical protein
MTKTRQTTSQLINWAIFSASLGMFVIIPALTYQQALHIASKSSK